MGYNPQKMGIRQIVTTTTEGNKEAGAAGCGGESSMNETEIHPLVQILSDPDAHICPVLWEDFIEHLGDWYGPVELVCGATFRMINISLSPEAEFDVVNRLSEAFQYLCCREMGMTHLDFINQYGGADVSYMGNWDRFYRDTAEKLIREAPDSFKRECFKNGEGSRMLRFTVDLILQRWVAILLERYISREDGKFKEVVHPTLKESEREWDVSICNVVPRVIESSSPPYLCIKVCNSFEPFFWSPFSRIYDLRSSRPSEVPLYNLALSGRNIDANADYSYWLQNARRAAETVLSDFCRDSSIIRSFDFLDTQFEHALRYAATFVPKQYLRRGC